MTNPDYRALITEMAAELDHCQQLLLDDRRQRHPLAARARAALAKADGPAVPDGREPASVATQPTEPEAEGPRGCPAAAPVPVSERLPGPEDLNDKGECWEWDSTSDAWVLIRPIGLTFRTGPWLPANALPLPAPEGEEVS